MKKTVITGRGLVTPLGNGLKTNEDALFNGRSGIVFVPEWKKLGMESNVAGLADEDPSCPLTNNSKIKRFMPPNARMAAAATFEALAEAGISTSELKGKKVAIILGCAGSAHRQLYDNAKLFADSGRVKKVSPFVVPKVMPSSAVANLSLLLGVTGESYDISSACTSSTHAIMISARLIEAGTYDIIITGGTEEVSWTHALGFDAMRALSRKYNDRPTEASRPFDRDRDGFVIASGAGILILESIEGAKKRGARPLSIISGFGTNSNGTDMVVPDASSSSDVMRLAIEDAGLNIVDIDYINTHGTSTPAGDPSEMSGIKMLFGSHAGTVAINSTKSMTGHMIGATGAVEAIFCSMMIEKNFISPSINLNNPDDGFEWADFVRGCHRDVNIKHALCNSFGFGGTNASLVISAVNIH